MARQLDLAAPPGLRVEPAAGHKEPRLWVRRLVLWTEPGVVLREVTLRGGLNIIWSPDPADRDPTDESGDALGHGSGKTLFCRLLRYCLGEESFAPDSQRESIAVAFKEGMVGAEIIVDGTPWAILRSIGLGRRNIAQANGNLDALAAGSQHSTGMAPFLEAVETQIISAQVADMVPGDRAGKAWLIALAWLARDQECRFDDVLDWRSSESDSGSPARGLSATRTLDALRVLMGAIAPEEQSLRAEAAELQQAQSTAEREAAHYDWEAEQATTRLAAALRVRPDQLPQGALAIAILRKAALDQFAALAADSPATDAAGLDSLRSAWDQARTQVEAVGRELAEIDARIPELQRLLSTIQAELPGLTFSLHKSEHSVCPICEVPIDRALAEGCKLSHKLPDLDAVRQRRETRLQEFQTETQRLRDDREKRTRLAIELGAARSHANLLRQRLQTAELASEARKDAWYASRRLIDDVDRLGETVSAQERSLSDGGQLSAAIEDRRERAAAYRDQSARVFQGATELFDAIVRDLASPQARGRVTLDGNGLHLAIDLGGERSTAAIESLKVLAFDLAALCMSINGATHVPAFLVHDSPREADLGLSAYHRLFRFVRSLEQIGDQPLFQYIVTTTTRPPDELRAAPWLRLTLKGAPAEERLLRRDL
jgi:hypothetical protein